MRWKFVGLIGLLLVGSLGIVSAVSYSETFGNIGDPGGLLSTYGWALQSLEGDGDTGIWPLNGGLTGDIYNSDFLAYYNDATSFTWTNYKMTVPGITVPIPVGKGEAGIAFRVQLDKISFYYAVLDPINDQVQFGKYVNGVYNFPTLTADVVNSGESHKLSVEVEEDNIRIYIDDILKIDTTDSSFASGGIGVVGFSRPGAVKLENIYWDEIIVGESQENSCLFSDDIIMKLYSATNSHGALWNDGSYNYDICYSDYFPGTGTGSRTCAQPSSELVSLYSQSNSHAEVPNGANGYSNQVCYDDLSCRVVDTGAGQACNQAGEEIVLSLYDTTNSNLAAGNFSGYDIKICCKSEAEEEVYWADMNGNQITRADIGDTVLMVYQNMAGSNYEFEIWEDDLFEDNTWFDDKIRNETNTFDYNGNLAAKWVITREDYKKGNTAEDCEFCANNDEEFYFKVNGINSGILLIDKGSYNNSMPSAQIIKPGYKEIYVINELTGITTNIPFEQISQDADDDLKLTWDFGDRSSEVFENIKVTKLGNTTHNYTIPGTKSILLTAREMSPPRSPTKAQSVSDATEIYIYGEGIIVFAIISEPSPDEITQISERFIDVNASATHVVNCSYDLNNCQASAPGGTCDTINGKLGNTIYCYRFPQPEQNKIMMNWTFYTGDVYESNKQGVYGGFGTDDYNNYVEFPHSFDEPGEHTLNLRAIYSV